jgi:hypothetical protein
LPSAASGLRDTEVTRRPSTQTRIETSGSLSSTLIRPVPRRLISAAESISSQRGLVSLASSALAAICGT